MTPRTMRLFAHDIPRTGHQIQRGDSLSTVPRCNECEVRQLRMHNASSIVLESTHNIEMSFPISTPFHFALDISPVQEENQWIQRPRTSQSILSTIHYECKTPSCKFAVHVPTMRGNKYRVYLAAFSRDGISNNPQLEPSYGRAMYHWGIWLEPKNSQGQGRLYHVEHHEPMNSATGPIPGGWKFGLRQTSSHTSQRLIGRIMIGKLPAGKDYNDIEHLLSQVPVPTQGSGEEDCITWVMEAIRVLQKQEPNPWAEEFDVDKLMDHAYGRFKDWYASNKWQFADNKESYVVNELGSIKSIWAQRAGRGTSLLDYQHPRIDCSHFGGMGKEMDIEIMYSFVRPPINTNNINHHLSDKNIYHVAASSSGRDDRRELKGPPQISDIKRLALGYLNLLLLHFWDYLVLWRVVCLIDTGADQQLCMRVLLESPNARQAVHGDQSIRIYTLRAILVSHDQLKGVLRRHRDELSAATGTSACLGQKYISWAETYMSRESASRWGAVDHEATMAQQGVKYESDIRVRSAPDCRTQVIFFGGMSSFAAALGHRLADIYSSPETPGAKGCSSWSPHRSELDHSNPQNASPRGLKDTRFHPGSKPSPRPQPYSWPPRAHRSTEQHVHLVSPRMLNSAVAPSRLWYPFLGAQARVTGQRVGIRAGVVGSLVQISSGPMMHLKRSRFALHRVSLYYTERHGGFPPDSQQAMMAKGLYSTHGNNATLQPYIPSEYYKESMRRLSRGWSFRYHCASSARSPNTKTLFYVSETRRKICRSLKRWYISKSAYDYREKLAISFSSPAYQLQTVDSEANPLQSHCAISAQHVAIPLEARNCNDENITWTSTVSSGTRMNGMWEKPSRNVKVECRSYESEKNFCGSLGQSSFVPALFVAVLDAAYFLLLSLRATISPLMNHLANGQAANVALANSWRATRYSTGKASGQSGMKMEGDRRNAGWTEARAAFFNVDSMLPNASYNVLAGAVTSRHIVFRRPRAVIGQFNCDNTGICLVIAPKTTYEPPSRWCEWLSLAS
ncbi:hypothetical protein ACRALDRAFT_205365 [Sodiomyces alcalophilus JCM 7366]|uniref:uncharacterized protein n=1 Tax=Sodiomyces alcalophilus JCM 7366 TaxID=591952 RepID=UPI0039B56B39